MKKFLVDCHPGDHLRIVEVHAGNGASLNLSGLGLEVGDTVQLLQRSPLHGPVLMLHRNTEIAIGHGLAKKIEVELVE